MADTWVNEKAFFLFLRLWQEDTGKVRSTFQELAEAFGYADRRNGQNSWQAFRACGGECLAFPLRKRKGDVTVVAAGDAKLRANIHESLTEVCVCTNAWLGRSDLSISTIRTAWEQIPCPVIRDPVVAQWEAGQIPQVCARAKHLRCLFHQQQGVTRWVKKYVPVEGPEGERIKKHRKRVVHTPASRMAHRRLNNLEQEETKHGWGSVPWIATTRKNVGRLMPALRRNQYPQTTNTIERFFRAFPWFYTIRRVFMR